MRRRLEKSVEAGLAARLITKLRPDRASRVRRRIRRFVRPARLGTLRCTTPLSRDFGWDRGTPIDRYYIERFLEANRRDISGRVLEIKDSTYTDRFGSSVTESAILDVDAGNIRATIVADLATADAVPTDSLDCVILTQTLQFVYDVRSALEHVRRALKPGGVLLATVPAISPVIDDEELDYYWRFSAASCRALFREVFGNGAVRVREHGNVLTAIAFLAGMAYEELTVNELEGCDRRFTVVVSIRAVKEVPAAASEAASVARSD